MYTCALQNWRSVSAVGVAGAIAPLFKAEAVGECQQPVSIAAIALSRGLNASVLRRWVKEAERSGIPIAIRNSAPNLAALPTTSYALGIHRLEVDSVYAGRRISSGIESYIEVGRLTKTS